MLLGGTALAAPHGFAAELGGGDGVPWAPSKGENPYYGTRDDRFFTPEERETVAAICARLIPSDDDGPGATEADVVTFIDRQMAGFYGRGQHWYMKGPYSQGTATQGYQSEHPQRSCTDWRLRNSRPTAHPNTRRASSTSLKISRTLS
ncbi:gluconate 2-dehydrogenase subunit 3 family protein [Neoaquamicrobium sediminum]|uniref:gluconate 2-dehydrogenase subunit 3 family protein n=1 Tax=Neoaquamicrobium sediminum TaxID=1849104 RepID=UPI0035E45C14